jgi:hypothetical protein
MRWVAHLLATAAMAAGCTTPLAPLKPVDGGGGWDICDGGPLLAVSVPSIDFGDVVAFTTATQVVTVSNCSNQDLMLTPSIGGPRAGVFSLDRPEGVAFSVPAYQSVALNVTYAPMDWGLPAQFTEDSATVALADENRGALLVALRGKWLSSGLVFSLPGLDFGFLAPGESRTSSIWLINSSDATLDVPTLNVWSFDLPPRFSLAPDSWNGGILAPGDEREVKVTFSPPAIPNSYAAALMVGSFTGIWATLAGQVALPALSCSLDPLSCTFGRGGYCPPCADNACALDFGWVPLNASRTLSMVCVNTGGPDLVLDISADDAVFKAQVDPDSPSPASTASPLTWQGYVLIDVAYTPTSLGASEGTVTVTANQGAAVESATATGVGFTTDLGPCDLAVTPVEGIGLGLVQVDTTADGGFVITNVGTSECLLDAFTITSGCEAAFGIPSSLAGQRLSTDGGGDDYPNSMIIPVSLTPPDAGLYSCYFDIDLDAGQPPFAAYVWGRAVAD